MEDYSKGKIYRIISDHVELPYIGSTTDSLEYRFDVHKRWYKKWLNKGKQRKCGDYLSSAVILEHSDARIELVTNYPCNSKEELRRYEGSFQEIGVNCVNLKKAGRTKAEYEKVRYQQNKAKILEQQKAPHIRAYHTALIECECGDIIQRDSIYRHLTSERHLNFLEDPEKEMKRRARLKKENEETPKYHCPCGSVLKSGKPGTIAQHKTTKKHQSWLSGNKK